MTVKPCKKCDGTGIVRGFYSLCPSCEGNGYVVEQHWCKHYTGVHNHTCTMGFRYTDFNNGSDFGIVHKLPCLIRNKDTAQPCSHFALLTKEQVDEMQRKGKEAFTDYLVREGIKIAKEKKNAK